MRISHTKEKGQRREGEQKVDSPVNLPTDPAVSQSQTAKAANIYFRLKKCCDGSTRFLSKSRIGC